MIKHCFCKKWERLLLIVTILIFFFAQFVLTCPISISNCTCETLQTGSVQLKCRLDNKTNLSSFFKKLPISIDYDKIIILKCLIPTMILEPLPNFKIRSLQISGCSVTKIQENAFDEIANTLEELILSYNNISTLPFLKKLYNLNVINLNYNVLRDIPEHSFDGLDQLKQIRVKNNYINLLLPNALNEVKSKLELLDLSGNRFTTIPAQNLRNSINLAYLSLANNQINEINQMQLMNLPSLIELRLDNNFLTRIPPNAFINVPMLTHLFARGNKLRKFDSTTLQAFKQLKLIDLGKNYLQKIPQFKDHSNLTEIHLDSNRIEKIETLTFSGNPNLIIINLRNNQISSISRNSFDALDRINFLFLSNNSLKTLDRYMFDGMKNLRYLALTNNSITEINPMAFSSIPNLYALDLSNNQIQRIKIGTFSKLTKLDFLVLSNNTHLTHFERGSFQTRIGTIFLDGIELNCDDEFDWFILYLLRNNVRTFIPNQPEICCSTPPKHAGKRLKDLMMSKANETLTNSMQNLGFGKNVLDEKKKDNVLTRFLSNLGHGGINGLAKMGTSIPVLHSITQAMPSLREIPGLNMLIARSGQSSINKNLDSAIEQFTEPIINFATVGQPLTSDLTQLLKSIPNLVVNIPQLGDVDITKLPPEVIQTVLNGGQIPGIPQETTNLILKQFMERLYYAAAKAQNIEPVGVASIPENINSSKYLIPVENLPNSLVTSAMNGGTLPHLDQRQTKTVLEYYTQQIPSLTGVNLTSFLSPKTLEMMKLLPRGFNMSELPSDFIRSAMRGELPDLSLLPPSLLQHFKDNLDQILIQIENNKVSEMSIESVLKKLPKFEPIDASTFSPYDINDVDSDLVVSEYERSVEVNTARLYTAIGLGLISALTIAILAIFCYRLSKKQRVTGAGLKILNLKDDNSGGLGELNFNSGLENSTVYESPAKQSYQSSISEARLKFVNVNSNKNLKKQRQSELMTRHFF